MGLGALVLYISTICPTIYVEDSAEFSTAAAVFGVPHPPGYPLYTVLAGLFVRAFPIADIGYRSNLFSAFCGALTTAVLWVLLRRLQASRPAALTAIICFATGVAFWSQCLAAEVHTLNCVLIASTLLFAIEAARNPSRMTFVLAGLFAGLTLGHRNLNALYLAPLVVVLEMARRRKRGSSVVVIYGLLALTFTAAVYLYLPLAARRDPWLNMSAPTTWERFYSVISTQAYFRHLATASATTDVRRGLKFVTDLPANLGLSIVALPFGFATWYRRKEFWTMIPIAWIAVTCFCFSTCYNVVDVDSYFIPSYLALAIAAGVGFDTWRGKWQRLLPVAALAGIPLVISSVTLHHTTIARDYGRQLLSSAPPSAIVISFADTETHVFGYEQGVEGLRTDAIVVSANEIDHWYVQQLTRRHPGLDWPPGVDGANWLAGLVERNISARPICLTQPIDLGIANLKEVPTGLLYCLSPSQNPARADLERSVAFWKTAVTPSQAELVHPEVHVQMINFAFALSRFALAGALAEAGEFAEARSQLAAVVAARPDASERAIAISMSTIGREDHRALALGQRSEQALRLDPRDSRFLKLLRL